MARSNAFLGSILVFGGAAALAAAVACTGGPGGLPQGGGDDDDVSASTSGISSSSGIGSSGTTSSSGASSSSGTPTGPTSVSDTFSHSCNTDDDCTLALLDSNVCGFCSGQNAAIAKSDQGKYQTAYNQARANCPPTNAAGTCAAYYSVSQCNPASKTCQLISCGTRPGPDDHHCAPDGG